MPKAMLEADWDSMKHCFVPVLRQRLCLPVRDLSIESLTLNKKERLGALFYGLEPAIRAGYVPDVRSAVVPARGGAALRRRR